MKKIVIDKDLLYKIYVEENHNIKETTDILNNEYDLNVSQRTVQRQIKEYNFNKDQKQVLETRKSTNIKLYGVENAYQSEEIKEKCKQTKLEKYGDENYNNKEQQQKTMIDKYGVKCGYNTETTKKTMIEKYGVDHPMKSKDLVNKLIKTNIERYGHNSPLQNKEIIAKSLETQRKNHGGKLAWNTDKQRQTMMKKYGTLNGFNDKAKNTMLKKYGSKYTVHSKELFDKMKKTNLERYGVEYSCLTENCLNSHNTISRLNINFSNKLNENNINNKLEFGLKTYSYDIHILNTNILIEINPTYTHNSTIGPYFSGKHLEPKKHDYHFNKSKLAKENGYHCIHIFDWDDIDKIINILKPKEAIPARKCEIKEVSKEDCKAFEMKNHLQGYCNHQDIRLGLYYNNELVQLITFGKPRYNKNYEHELIRLCSSENYAIIGGSEKLFKYFIEKYSPNSIISYCDNAKFNGNVYSKLGFEMKSYGSPSKHWWNGERHITDNLLRQQGFDRLFNASYGKGTSNEQLMLEYGFVEIYDCGQSTYVWRNINE